MRPGDIEEIIYQFAGYLNLYDDALRPRVEYDSDHLSRPADDFLPAQPNLDVEIGELENLGGTRLIVSYRVEQPVSVKYAQDSDGFPFTRVPPLGNEAIAGAKFGIAKPALEPLPFEVPKFIHVAYDVGGDQSAIEAWQLNRMVDSDSAGIADDALIASLRQYDADDLNAIYQDAAGEIPAEFRSIGSNDTSALIDLFAARNAAWKADGDFIRGDVESGTYLNGVLQADDSALPVEPDQIEPPLSLGIDDSDEPPLDPDPVVAADADADADDNEDAADEEETGVQVQITEPQIAEAQEASAGIFAPADSPAQTSILGANDAVNAGAILDINHATGSMMVFGDYYKTDIIAQVVSYMDDDSVTYAGAGVPDIETGGTQANNIAKFLSSDPGVGSFAGTGVFAGSDWKVDVFDGDLYDVRALTQTIWLEDNDISFQNNEDTHYQVLAGANEQGNFGLFNTVIGNYDLVLVMGDYNQANVIVQKIVLLDPDTLKVLASTDAAPAGGAGVSATTGGNWLLNDATIENYSTGVINPVPVDWYDILDDLLDGKERIDTDAGWGLPNFGDPTFDVLLVTGSIYDLNIISQSIVVSDADTAMQMLSDDAGDVAQSAVLGSNHLNNIATIVSTGPAADFYVGGDTYDEEMLINAEILVSDDDGIHYGDPAQLATELVAFASQASAEDEPEEAYSALTSTAPTDLLGGTMG